MQKNLGSLEPGNFADILAVSGDPLKDHEMGSRWRDGYGTARGSEREKDATYVINPWEPGLEQQES